MGASADPPPRAASAPAGSARRGATGLHPAGDPTAVSPAAGALTELAEAFSAELTHWREVRGLSKKRLAAEMGFDPSYVSHIESGRHRPTEDFARRAESVLNSSHALWRRWQAFDAARRIPDADGVPREVAHADPSAGLVVEHEDSRLEYRDGVYRVRTRRRLRNVGAEPISRFLMRISVDRHPDDPERSNRLYRANPLTWDELRLHAAREGEPMAWMAKHDRDAFKEVWLQFENATSQFPLYPGEGTWIDYGYQVSDHKWGSWFQRAIRLPTTRLSVRLSFPADLAPAVWGTETSMTAAAAPFRTAIARHAETGDDAERTVFDWATDHPPLHARFRLEWRFRGQREGPPRT
jgi:transcriptional regulator with XRE-family HTH domain